MKNFKKRILDLKAKKKLPITKKNKHMKLLAILLSAPLLLYGAICLYFYLEKQKSPLVTYQIIYGTDSNRSPADFKTDSEGNRVYMNKKETGSVACWDCYDKSWTERMRNSIGGALPSTLRADKGSQEAIPLSCGRGVAQAGMDIGLGITLIIGGGVAYVIEPLSPSGIELRKHRWNQVKYGFYFVKDGKLFEVVSDSVKKLYRHISKSFKQGDTFAICEVTTVVLSLILGPKIKANWNKDTSKVASKERSVAEKNLENFDEIIKSTKQDIDNLKPSIEKAQKEAAESNTKLATVGLSNLVARKTVLQKKLSDSLISRYKYITEDPMGMMVYGNPSKIFEVKYFNKNIMQAKKNLRDVKGRLWEYNQVIKHHPNKSLALDYKKEMDRLFFLKENYEKSLKSLQKARRTVIKESEAVDSGFKRAIRSQQLAKSPVYVAQAIRQKAVDFVPLKPNQIILKPLGAATVTGGSVSTHTTGQRSRTSKTFQDYLDSLPISP